MEKSQNLNFKKIAIVATIVAVGLLSWFIYYSLFVFHVVSISPETSKVSTLNPRFVVTFNQPLTENNLSIESGSLILERSISGKQLTLNIMENMSASTQYTINIKQINSTSGGKLIDYKLTFKPISDDSLLSQDSLNIMLERQQASKPAVQNDPILTYLPHSTLDYSLDPLTVNNKVQINAKIFLSAADIKIDREGAINNAKNEINTYLNSLKGITMSNYIVNYDIIES